MKTLSITLPDEIYDNVERQAVAVGVTLEEQVRAWVVKSVGAKAEQASLESRSERLLKALDGANNSSPVGPLNREALYDRDQVR